MLKSNPYKKEVDNSVIDCNCSIFNKYPDRKTKHHSFKLDNKTNVASGQNERPIRTAISVDRQKKISVSNLNKNKSRQNSLKNGTNSKTQKQDQDQELKITYSRANLQKLIKPQIQQFPKPPVLNNDAKMVSNHHTRILSFKPYQKTNCSTTNLDNNKFIKSSKNTESKLETFNSTNYGNSQTYSAIHQPKRVLFNYGTLTQSSDPQIFYQDVRPYNNIYIPPLVMNVPQTIPQESTSRSNQPQQKYLYLKQAESFYDKNEQKYEDMQEYEFRDHQKLNYKKINSIGQNNEEYKQLITHLVLNRLPTGNRFSSPTAKLQLQKNHDFSFRQYDASHLINSNRK